jgi:hypothetical protein
LSNINAQPAVRLAEGFTAYQGCCYAHACRICVLPARQAVEFVQLQRDDELWEQLIALTLGDAQLTGDDAHEHSKSYFLTTTLSREGHAVGSG